MDAQVLRRRCARALAVCTVVLVVVAMMLLRLDDGGEQRVMGAHLGDASPMDGPTYVSRVWKGMDSGDSESDALADAGFLVYGPGSATLPQWFASEIFELADGQRLALDRSGALANIVFQGAVDDAMRSLDAALRQNGWTQCGTTGSSSESEGAGDPDGQVVYRKKGGTCRWLMLTPMEVEGETSVTMHIQRV